ncbi:hypothetical protein [Acinetobacter baumannii]|uniref:hypothetical protein n=1 Tax=Acinetobacter baumannii TaxID=470 RepID=UPI0038923BFB
MKSLEDFLSGKAFFYEKEYSSLYLDGDVFSPGYLCALAAFIKANVIEYNNFDTSTEVMSYLRTLGFHKVLWNKQDNINRCNSGKSYSPLTALVHPSEVDSANSTINSCIRDLVNNLRTQGISDLCKVVGELHDNVWSHGKSTGFSMAQRTKVPHTNGRDYFIEFALSDNGLGFLEELKRTKIPIQTDEDAIAWCIQEGNSSKLNNNDSWAQRLPDDHVGEDPMAGYGAEIPENNHQGLGLAHLIKLIKTYKGELKLCTGDTIFSIDSEDNETYTKISTPWQGVSISCKFKLSELSSEANNSALNDPQKQYIMAKLRGAI